MDEAPNKTPDQSVDPPSARELPLDTRLLSEAIIELNISRKNVGIYPPGHIQIIKSIQRAYSILSKIFEIRSEITLGIAKDTLLVGHDYLDQKNPVYRDFALSLNQQGIAAVTFLNGLNMDELTVFHQLITTKPDDIRAWGGIEQVMAGASLAHIRIKAIDFSHLHVTEEEKITRSTVSPSSAKTGTGLWQDFIAHLSAGTLAGRNEQGVSLGQTADIDPVELARLLNEQELDSTIALESYDRIISDHIREHAEKKELTREQSETLANLNTLLLDLHPALRKQFLSVAFRRISSQASAADRGGVLGGFTDDMVVDMLKQASAEGKEISPALTGLLAKLTKAHAQSAMEETMPSPGTASSSDDQPGVFLPEHMEKLFSREKHEEYVGEDYEALLQGLREGAPTGLGQLSLEEYAKSLEEDHLDFQMGRALLAFMEENLDEEDYREFAKKLMTIMPGFLTTGNFFLLWDIYESLRRHTLEKPLKGIRECALEARKAFLTPEFRSQALHAFEVWMREKGQEAAGFIQALGSECVPGLMEIYCRDETAAGRRILTNLLCIFGNPAIREAHKRLRDVRPHAVKNLLLFLRRAGNQTSLTYIRPLLNHRDPGIRMEALSTLLKLKDADAITMLRKGINSSDPDIAFQSIALAGQYQIKESVGDILAKIKHKILFEPDYERNEELIKALGEIGDPRAIRELERLAQAAWPLYPRSLLHMKEILFHSLERYPREQITRLLEIGESLGHEPIRRSCRKLQEKK
ncbi:MAG: HEAT repeat domain-containing protein [Nitrospirota bacterium]